VLETERGFATGMGQGVPTKLEGMHSPLDVIKPKLRVNSRASKSIGAQRGFAVTMLSPRGSLIGSFWVGHRGGTNHWAHEIHTAPDLKFTNPIPEGKMICDT